MSDRILPPLDSLEQASGMVFGRRRSPSLAASLANDLSPRAAIESLLLPALERTPCLVAFSGGRDSSAVLAAAAAVARRHGLELPIPCTLRFASDPQTDEWTWQERMIEHLALDEWLKLDLSEELDALGPIATSCLERFGAYWPPLAHTWVPLFEAARGGSVLGGNGGDEFLSAWRLGRLWQVRRGRLRPTATDMKAVALFALPTRLRSEIWRRRVGFQLPWLTRAADVEVQRLWAAESTTHNRSWGESAERLLDSRYLEVAVAIFDALARSSDTLLVEPLRAAEFVRAVIRSAPTAGFRSRAEALEHLFGDLLPDDVIGRTTKATFTNVPWGPAARQFATTWDGAGVDTGLVDLEGARGEWLSDRPDFRSLTPLQGAWLATRRSSPARASDQRQLPPTPSQPDA